MLLKQRSEQADLIGYRRKKASKKVAKQLAQAKSMINEDKKVFFGALLKGINEYLSDKLNLPTAALTQENIRKRLISEGVDKQEIDTLLNTIEQCEMARFAPVDHVATETVFQQINKTITSINQQIK